MASVVRSAISDFLSKLNRPNTTTCPKCGKSMKKNFGSVYWCSNCKKNLVIE